MVVVVVYFLAYTYCVYTINLLWVGFFFFTSVDSCYMVNGVCISKAPLQISCMF